jgi:hypothetical protein
LNAIYGEQYFDGFLPEAIIVGITWGGENPNPDLLRRRDFTPTEEKLQLPSGGADKFLSFIKNELVPFIDTEFRTKTNDRTLMGSSLGGLFTLYAMLNETSLFNKYVLTSPAISWDSGVIYSNEEKYFNKKHDLPVKLFMAIGEYEDVKDFEKFSTKLSERHYSDFQMKTRVLDGIGHSGTKAEGYTRGLQYAFEKTPLKLSGEILKQYEGTYEINSALKLIVSEADMNLTAEVPGITKLTLSAESESDFYIIGQYLRMYFKKGIDGSVNGVEVEKYAGRQFLKKIE